MEERGIRAALSRHSAGSASGDRNTEHEIYAVHYLGRLNCTAAFSDSDIGTPCSSRRE
jgi:hypothetical protein